MGLKVGIVGLPNAGKSTLFNAILGRQQALTAPYPFATVEPNVGVVEVEDERLIKLRDALFPASGRILEGVSLKDRPLPEQPPLVFATVTFVDIAGLVKGAADGQGLGNQFLSHIRDVDLILHVLRDFDEGIPRAEDSKNPEHDAEIVKTELELKDLEIEERRKKEKGKRKKEEGWRLAEKPVIYAVNISEEKLTQVSEHSENSAGRTVKQYNSETVVSKSVNSKLVADITDIPAYRLTDYRSTVSPLHRSTDAPVFYFCAKLEEEISKMPKNEQKEYLKIYGLERSCLDRIIGECFRALGLISFFTAPASADAPAGQAGKWEIRAWPVKKDSPAPAAAGAIHSDFERLFIRAEVINWEKLAQARSWQKAKEKGLVRTEGKEYLMQDGDVVNFLIGK